MLKARRRREFMWEQFQKTLPESERDDGRNKRKMFALDQNPDPSRQDMGLDLEAFRAGTESALSSGRSGNFRSWTPDNPEDRMTNHQAIPIGKRFVFGFESSQGGDRDRGPFSGTPYNPLRSGKPLQDEYSGSAYSGVRGGIRVHDEKNSRVLTPMWWERGKHEWKRPQAPN